MVKQAQKKATDLLTAFLVRVFLVLFEKFPAMTAHDHTFSTGNILHTGHELSTEHRVTITKRKKDQKRMTSI